MSYILDALRKAERERSFGETPGAEALQYHHGVKKSVARWPFVLLAAVLICNLGLLAWLFWPRDKQIPTAPTKPVSSAHVQAMTDLGESPPQLESASSPTNADEIMIRIAQPEATASIEQPFSGNAAEKPAQPRAARKQLVAPVAAGAKEPEIPVVRQPADIASPAQDNESSRFFGRSISDPVFKPEPILPRPTENRQVPELANLPSGFRQSVPTINLDFHFFSDTAKRSFVLINGEKYRNGADLSPGLRLEKITAEGMVLVKDGQRFLLPLEQR